MPRAFDRRLHFRQSVALVNLYGWGLRPLGDGGTAGTRQNSPILLQSGTDIALMRAYQGTTGAFAFRISSANVMQSFGTNSLGNLGLGDTTQRYSWTTVTGSWKKVAIGSTGAGFAIAIKTDGTIWHTGNKAAGVFGDGSTTGNNLSFTQIGTDTDWADVICGNAHVVAIKTNGDVYTWGSDSQGQCARNASITFGAVRTVGRATLSTGANATGCLAIAAFASGTVVLDSASKMFACGAPGSNPNATSQGRLTSVNSTVYTSIRATAFNSSTEHLLAKKSDGSYEVWGYNPNGELGLGDNTTRSSLTAFDGGSTAWTDIAIIGASSRGYSAVGIKTGALYGWGLWEFNGSGATSGNLLTPTQIGSFTDWKGIYSSGGTIAYAWR